MSSTSTADSRPSHSPLIHHFLFQQYTALRTTNQNIRFFQRVQVHFNLNQPADATLSCKKVSEQLLFYDLVEVTRLNDLTFFKRITSNYSNKIEICYQLKRSWSRPFCVPCSTRSSGREAVWNRWVVSETADSDRRSGCIQQRTVGWLTTPSEFCNLKYFQLKSTILFGLFTYLHFQGNRKGSRLKSQFRAQHA